MRVIMSNRANINIKEIFYYIYRNSPKYAKETTKNIRLRINDLKYSPYLGRYVPEMENKRYREIIYKSYRIVYEIFEESNIIYIHFVVHGKRNFKSFFDSYIEEN